jgi:hypothetical protein
MLGDAAPADSGVASISTPSIVTPHCGHFESWIRLLTMTKP